MGGRGLLERVVGRSLLARMSSGGEEGEVPDGATARKLIKEFETVTNTDEILAQYQLQVTRCTVTHLSRSTAGTCGAPSTPTSPPSAPRPSRRSAPRRRRGTGRRWRSPS